MVFHQVQCPSCFTEYAISDTQYQAAEGMIRCGTCRGQYRAILLSDSRPTPKFDPREAFIEPLSETLKAADGGDIKLSGEPEPSYVGYEKPTDPDEHAVELMSSHEFEYTGPKEPPVPEEVIAAYGSSDELSTSEILWNLRRKGEKKTLTESLDEAFESQNNTLQDALPLEPKDSASDQRDLQHNRKNRNSNLHTLDNTNSANNDKLIDQVDKLVNKKIIGSTPIKRPIQKRARKKTPNQRVTTKSPTDDFFLEPRKPRLRKKNSFVHFIGFLLSLVLILMLITGLLYQLWLKQIIDLPKNQAWLSHPMAEKVEQFIVPQWNQYIVPQWDIAKQKLAAHDIQLPQRRNLSQLELVSAQTEPHPSRTTKVLLKVSLINRAKIAQSLPWLEMSLTDADGRLVARRNLSPVDYIYNNKTNLKIGPNELKKVTIELLSFPKSATGYEIKLLNN